MGGLGERVEEKVVELGEFRMNLGTSGSGPAMVLLHGADKRQTWKLWEPLLSLASGFTMVMPDLIGFGGSTRPVETPDHRTQARVVHEMMDKLSVGRATIVGASWGGQVALELAIAWPESVESLVLISSTYDKAQIPRMPRIRRPTLIIWAEDDLVAQLKAGYLLRDAIRTSRLEVLEPVAKDPRSDFTSAHDLVRSRSAAVMDVMKRFLASPASMVVEPPEMEQELKGMALKPDGEESG